jgi:zinc transporter, ZIP family
VAVSFSETVLLGALAGFTIYLSLPLGRLDLLSARARVALAMFAVGVLAFLFVDGFEHAFEIVEEPVEGFRDGKQGIGEAIGLTALLGVGFAAGTAGLGMVEGWLRPKGTEPAADRRRFRRADRRRRDAP